MNDFFSKTENFIFDILGLILPGLIFLCILVIPLTLVDISKIPSKELNESYILSELSTLSNLLILYWNEKSNILIITIIILSYLLGHFVKVFSIIKYEILIAIFDKSINKLFTYISKLLKDILNWICQKILSRSLYTTRTYLWLKDILKPFKNTISKIFTFKSEDYFTDNENLRTECIELINLKFKTKYPNKWYSLYKFSTVITNQESIKSMAAFFLAKYNLYRSLAFIFLFAALYYNIFFSASLQHTSLETQKLSSLILTITGLLWFTFHYKYKRYWTLCGNETLVSLYYFLKKKEIDEN